MRGNDRFRTNFRTSVMATDVDPRPAQEPVDARAVRPSRSQESSMTCHVSPRAVGARWWSLVVIVTCGLFAGDRPPVWLVTGHPRRAAAAARKFRGSATSGHRGPLRVLRQAAIKVGNAVVRKLRIAFILRPGTDETCRRGLGSPRGILDFEDDRVVDVTIRMPRGFRTVKRSECIRISAVLALRLRRLEK